MFSSPQKDCNSFIRMGKASQFMAGMREIQIFDVPIFLMPIVGFRFEHTPTSVDGVKGPIEVA